MANITVLGLGAMGSRMAANLLRAGHSVSVWNRTPGTAAALQQSGANFAMTIAQAVADADFVIAMVRDDEASRMVWQEALPAMRAGSIAIESSTLSPEWVRQLGALVSATGIELLEAPVSGSRPQAEAGQLVYLVGGAEDTLEKAQALLQSMGAAVHHVGPLGSGALAKLATNALLGIQVSALAEVIGLLERQGANVQKTLQAISGTSVWAPVAHYLSGSMLAGDFRPQFPVELIAKDFEYTLAVAGLAEQAPTLAAALEVFNRGIQQGLGEENMTAVVQLFR